MQFCKPVMVERGDKQLPFSKAIFVYCKLQVFN